MRKLGRKAMAYSCHVGHWSEIDGLVEVTYNEFGKIDILINNAGMSPLTATSADVSEDPFDKAVGVNFKGPFRLSVPVGYRMAEDGAAHYQCQQLWSVSSSGAIRPTPTAIPYCGAKAALNALAEGFSAELGRSNVRVNTLSAGPFLTDIAKAWPEKHRQSVPSAVGRPGNPEEVIAAALFLASPYSSYVTSCLARVDGGLY